MEDFSITQALLLVQREYPQKIAAWNWDQMTFQLMDDLRPLRGETTSVTMLTADDQRFLSISRGGLHLYYVIANERTRSLLST